MKRVWFCCVTIALILSFSLSAVAAEPTEGSAVTGENSPETLSANGFYYYLNGNEAVLLGLAEPAETVVVPRELQGHKVTALAPFAFPRQEGVIAFDIEEGHPAFSAADGVLYNKNKTEIIRYPAAARNTDFSVPSSVTTVGQAAFYDCVALTQIRLGEQIRTINDYAFSQSGVVELTLPNTIKRLGNAWFKNCADLTRVVIPATVTSMASSTFSGCVSLTHVVLPPELTAIGEYAFEFCSSLETIQLPATVTSIGYSAFLGCTRLQELSISAAVTFIDAYAVPETALQVAPDNKNYTSIEGVLFNKAQSILLSYPNSKTQTDYAVPETVTTIGEGAFEGNSHLTVITLPKGLTAIGENAFSFCKTLTHVRLPSGLRTIGQGAFESCSVLRGMAIPPTVTKLEDSGIGVIGQSNAQDALPMEQFVVYGTTGSAAEQYAQKMGLLFTAKTAEEIEKLNQEGIPVVEVEEQELPAPPKQTENTAVIPPQEKSAPSFFSQYGVWLAIGGGVLLTAGVVVTVLLVGKKKKRAAIDEETPHTPTEKESDTD